MPSLLNLQRRLLITLIKRHRRDEMLLDFLVKNTRSTPRVWTENRSSHWWEDVVPSFSTQQWLQNFRMSEDTFTYLCQKLRPCMELHDTTFRLCVPLRKRVAIALWKHATGSEYRTIGHLFGVSITTVCRCVQDFCAAAESLLVPELLHLPDEGRFMEMSAYIENRWGLPLCVGAIDGSHIPIIAPEECHTDYFNRKGWHSIILQGVVDGKGLFWNVFAGLPGSMHDARVLRLSRLWELATRGNLFPPIRNIGALCTGYYILGDSAYPLQNWLLKPFHDSGRLTEEQHTFNQTISRVRVNVENAFGRLKGRWRCLLKRNDCDIELVKSMVVTCCALHNLCETHGEAFDTALDAAADEVVVSAAELAEDRGGGVRDALMQYLCTNN
ncbi:uncharacterized protein KZ484_010498 isoform 2-T4 [Pholidichthys leucotaenia]